MRNASTRQSLLARPSTLCEPTSGFRILCLASGLAVSHSRGRSFEHGLLPERLIPFSVTQRQPAKSSRRIHFHLNLMPFCFASDISRIEANRILVPKLQCDSRAYLDKFRLVVVVREECAAAGHPRNLFEYRTPVAGERIIIRVRNTYRIDLHVRFFDDVSKLLIRIAAVVVLTVRDYQERPLWVAALLNLFNADVGGVVKCGRTVWIREHQVAEDAVSRCGEVLYQLCAIVECYQEEIIVIVRGLDEPAQREKGPVNALSH